MSLPVGYLQALSTLKAGKYTNPIDNNLTYLIKSSRQTTNVKNSFIINIGDLMALWTNDRWTSTLHRVIPINRNKYRKTLVFFHQPNWDAKIKCLSSCVGEGSKYSEVFSGPYLMKKFKSTT